MPRPILWIVLLAGACGPVPTRSGSADSAAVAALVRDRLEAATAGDTARWHRGVSDSALWTGPALRPVRTPEVLGIIASNRQLQPGRSDIRDLQVVLQDGVAQATYLQLVPGPTGSPRSGKRFRKTDVYARRGGNWILVGATEISLPYRATRPFGAGRAEAIAGSYLLPGVDSITLVPTDSGVQLKARDGSVTMLLVANDSTLFEEGDPGEWILPLGGRVAPALIYRMSGAADIRLPRTPAS